MPFVVIYSHENGDVTPPSVQIHTDTCAPWASIIANDPQQLDWVTLPKVNTLNQARGIAQDYVGRTGAREWTRGKCVT